MEWDLGGLGYIDRRSSGVLCGDNMGVHCYVCKLGIRNIL